MVLELKQKLDLRQQLVLTPQLQQAIKLLQLSRIELLDVIKEEIKSNPLLEEKEQEEGNGTERKELEEASYDTGWDIYFEEYRDEYWYDKGRIINPGKIELPSLEATTAQKEDLFSHLIWQLNVSGLDEEKKRIGFHIIGNINEDGYLEVSIEEIAKESGSTPSKVEETLKIIQNFDPIGIGARDLRECLLIQARAYGLGGTIVEKIIIDYLEEIENQRYERIAEELSITLEDVLAAVQVIKGFDPRPGSDFFDERNIYIVPDVYVVKIGDEYEVVLNQEDIPILGINPYYKRLLEEKDRLGKKEREYLRERFKSAIWLIKSIYQRQMTIYKVTKSIVKFQKDFLEHGISHLRPLVLKDVAEDINMSESTVSRVTTNKYVQTPQGIFELKFFFSSSISGKNGKNISSLSVREYIKKIISLEDKKKPFSDEEIKKILERQYGIRIARRTIAKYREEIGIPSSKKRRIK